MVATSTLQRKLRGDLRRQRRQFAAVTMMVILGITFFVGLLGSMENLRLSIDEPYRDLRFADFTVSFERAPIEIVQTIQALPGVERAAGRLSLELPAVFPERGSDVIAGRVVSVPAPDRPAINDLLVTEGEYITGGSGDQVLAEKNFAVHHGLRVGDAVRIETPTGPWEGRIVGIAISPEYLWPARSLPEHMPDVLRRWGVLFLAYGSIGPAAGVDGSVNEIAVTVRDDADRKAVMGEVQAVLEPYRLTGIIPREDWPSQAVLDSMVGALDALSVVFPLLFLVIVALSTYVLLTRLVHAQRSQIGVLLALGFSRRRVLAHYMGFALLIGLLGSLLGSFGGYLLAFPVTDLFAQRISLPLVTKVPHWDMMATGTVLSLAITAAAGFLPAYRASRERPAETMRGEIPRNGSRHRRHRNHGSGKSTVTRKLPLRNLRRNPVRTGFTALALALAGSLVIVPFGFLDTMDGATDVIVRTSNFDLEALFYRPVQENMSANVATWDGVAEADPFLTTSTILRSPGSEFNVVLYGIEPASETYRLFTWQEGRVYPSDSGILLGKIFEDKGLRVGDAVTIGDLETRVAGFLKAFSNSGFLPLERTQAAFAMPGLVNGMFLRLSYPNSEEEVKERLYASLPVWSVLSVSKSLQDWDEMLRLYYGFIGVIVAFGMALAGAIVFNAVTTNVLERSREMATMRTIGMKDSQIARIITTENVLILLLSVVLGWILGVILTGYFMTLFGSDIFVLDTKISPRTFALSAVLLLGVLLVSEIPSLRFVQRLDLAKATKERAG